MTPNLTDTEKRVLIAVQEISEAGRIAYPDQLAQQLQIPQREVQAAIDQLLFFGFVADGQGALN